MLCINNLKFSYDATPNKTSLLYNFTVQDHRSLCIFGESGVGKTTLFDLIAGFLQPLTGKIIYNQDELDRLPTVNRPVSYLMQNHPIIEHMTVKDNIILGNKNYCNIELKKIAKLIGINDILDVNASKISGGQKQRALLLHVFLQKRKIVLLDEPFNGIDNYSKEKCINFIKDYIKNTDAILLFSTHNTEEIKALNAKTILLKKN